MRSALRRFRRHARDVIATDFGPRALKAYRQTLIDQGVLGRNQLNRDVRIVVRMFKWAVSEELVPAALHDALACVEPLRRGEVDGLREGKKVHSVPESDIAAVLPWVSRQVAALIELQRLTGARAGELVGLRPVDLDTTGDVWLFRPEHHKTAHRGHDRVIPFGPQCQTIIRPFLSDRPVDRPLFSPLEAEAERRAQTHAQRRTPTSCGNRPGTNRTSDPQRPAGDAYTTASYRRCIERACDQAFSPPADLARCKVPGKKGQRWESNAEWKRRLGSAKWARLEAWRKEHRWTPHRLRHAAATALRRQFGLEAASLILGHASAVVTEQTYAERDLSVIVKAAKVAG